MTAQTEQRPGRNRRVYPAHMGARTGGVFPWDDRNWGQCMTMAIEGLNARQIATNLGHGCTRNAVIGKIHRMGYSIKRLQHMGLAAQTKEKSTPAAPPPVRIAPLVERENTWQCRAPGCRNTRQNNRHGLCNVHNNRRIVEAARQEREHQENEQYA